MSDDKLAELIAQARSADPEAAWQVLFDACYPTLLRTVEQKLPAAMQSLFDPQDFVGDVMKRQIGQLDQLDFPSFRSLLAYLGAQAEQRVAEECRRLQLHEA